MKFQTAIYYAFEYFRFNSSDLEMTCRDDANSPFIYYILFNIYFHANAAGEVSLNEELN